MKLEYLVKHLRSQQTIEDLYDYFKLNKDSEVLLIYMQDDININSDVQIFEFEDTEDEIHYENKGLKYIQLFPVEMAQEIIEEYIKVYERISDHEICKKLIEYRLNDA